MMKGKIFFWLLIENQNYLALTLFAKQTADCTSTYNISSDGTHGEYQKRKKLDRNF